MPTLRAPILALLLAAPAHPAQEPGSTALQRALTTLREEIVRERRAASRERGLDEVVSRYEARVAADVNPAGTASGPDSATP